ncbi:AAA family ATPase, partial [Chloroflexota bacterium]
TSIQEGQRNLTLTSLGGTMQHRGMPLEAIKAALLEVNNLQCQPPLEEKEVLAIVKSVTRYEPTTTRQNEAPKITSARALSEWDFEDLKFALPGMIPEGFTILAGKPKSGKSWWALQAAYSVAQGENLLDGSVCNRGRALVLGLEDSMRRLQDRVNKLYSSDFILHSSTKLEGGGLRMRVTMGRTEIPEGLDLVVKWPKIGDGCIEELEKYLNEHPDTRLIVVDIIKRITRKKGRGTTYDEDYDSIQPLQELAIKRGVAILGVHHTRKALSDDPIEMVSGTFGFTGGADSIIVVQRVAEGESKFSFSGRDISMQELAMQFNEKNHRWTCLGDADSHFISDERERIIDCLGDDSLSPSEVSRLLGKNPSTTRTMLFKMLRDGQLEKDSKGKYSVDKPKIADRFFNKQHG